eukprot:1908459-Rhodomonas_salina.2
MPEDCLGVSTLHSRFPRSFLSDLGSPEPSDIKGIIDTPQALAFNPALLSQKEYSAALHVKSHIRRKVDGSAASA